MSTDTTITVTLPTGMILKGTKNQVLATMQALKYDVDTMDGLYWSESKGPVKIVDMHPKHLQNAILKEYRAWVQKLSELEPNDVVAAIREGITAPVWQALVVELARKTADVA